MKKFNGIHFPEGKVLKCIIIMKMIWVLLLFSGMQMIAGNALSYAQLTKLDLKLKDTSLESVIWNIKEQTEFNVFYNSKDVKEVVGINFNVKNATVEEILTNVLEGTDLTFNIMHKTIVIRKDSDIASQPLDNTVQQDQSVRLNGVVKDAETNEPLVGVNVYVKGTTQGTVTDFNGEFNLKVNPDDQVLVFSFIGFITQEITIGDQRQFDISMEGEISGLDEVVVVGYGSMNKRDLTGSVSKVEGKALENRPVLRVDKMLQGTSAGVDVKSVSGEPGAGTTIRIRGSRSINASNEPLYVVDGIIDGGNLNSINPEDIKSIEILKDASATAIYGSRGSNGVILISTKRGQKGKDKITVNINRGLEYLPQDRKPELLNAQEFVDFIIDAKEDYVPAHQLPYDQQYQYVTNLDLDAIGEGTDWMDEITRVGAFTNINVSASGGDEKLQYYLSGGYADQEGIAKGSGFKRYQGRLNLDKQFGEVVQMGASINLSHTNTDLTQMDFGKSTSWSRSPLQLAPVLLPYQEDGSYTSFNPFYYSGGGHIDTPLAYGELREKNQLRNNLLTNIYLNLNLAHGLKFRTSLGIGYDIRRQNYLNPTNMPTKIAAKKELGYASVNEWTYSNLLSENTLEYNKKFGDHSLNALVGATWQNRKWNWLFAGAKNLTHDILKWHKLSAAELGDMTVDSNYSENTMISYLGRFNYNYRSKYYVTFTGRYDGASNFAENHKWGFFPSAAVKWRLSEEDFLADSEVIDNVSLKLSYGKSGNQAIPNYASLSKLNADENTYIFNNSPTLGYYPGTLPNKDLTWESTTQFDVSVEFGLFNRIWIEAGYYNANTTDLLLHVQIPKQTGNPSRLQNLGETKNNGFEFLIDSKNLQIGKFSWNTKLTISTNEQEIVDLGPLVKVGVDNNSYGGQTTFYEVGVPLGALYGAYYEGTWKSQAEIDRELAKPAGEREFVSGSNYYKPGKMKYRDLNGDGILGEDDIVYQGSPNPKVFGGFGNNFKYGAWDLDVDFNYSFGGKMYNDVMFFMGTGSFRGGYTNQYKFYTERWHPTRNPTSNIPGPNSRDNVPSTYLLEDASFIRLSSVKLGYTLDADKIGMSFFDSAYFYASGNNLMLFTDYRGFDPEVNKNGTSSVVRGKDDGVFPNSRAFTFGLRVSF